MILDFFGKQYETESFMLLSSSSAFDFDRQEAYLYEIVQFYVQYRQFLSGRVGVKGTYIVCIKTIVKSGTMIDVAHGHAGQKKSARKYVHASR